MDVSRVLLSWPLRSSLYISQFTTSHNHVASHHMTSQPTAEHHKCNIPSLCITFHQITWHHIRSHPMTWHDIRPLHMTSHHISQPTTLPHVTSQSTTLLHLTSQPTSWHHTTSHHSTSHHYYGNTSSHHQNAATRRKGWRLVNTKNLVWAAHQLFALRTLYGQILSLACTVLPCETSVPDSPGNYW